MRAKEDFTNVSLENKRFLEEEFHGCNFSLTKLDKSRWQQVKFVDCKLVGLNWHLCDPMFLEISFENCLLRDCNFSGLPLKKTAFAGSRLYDCHFVETDLREVGFQDVEFQDCLFHHCNMEKADFKNASGYSIDPLSNKLKGAKFSSSMALSLLTAMGIKIV